MFPVYRLFAPTVSVGVSTVGATLYDVTPFILGQGVYQVLVVAETAPL